MPKRKKNSAADSPSATAQPRKISFQMDDVADREELKRLAELSNCNVSEYIRYFIDTALERGTILKATFTEENTKS